MRNLKIMLLASAATAVAFAAQAADAIYQAPEAPAATESYSAPAGNWSGAYVGGGITYDMGKFTGSNDGRDADGVGGTVYGGYNMQSGSIVYGGEADLSYAGEDGSAGTDPAVAGTIKGTQGVNGSIRGRVGYDLNPFLVYGTAGVAVATIGPASAMPEVRFLCEDAGARVLFVDADLKDLAMASIPASSGT